MLTWQAHDGHGFEGARVHFGTGKAFRALGRIVRAEPGGDWTASYRLVLNEDGGVQRASFTTATAERERHLTLNRTEDGFWLIDTGSGGTRTDFSGSIDIDLAGSVTFDALPVRRLDLTARRVSTRCRWCTSRCPRWSRRWWNAPTAAPSPTKVPSSS